jgi:hypothetical protein
MRRLRVSSIWGVQGSRLRRPWVKERVGLVSYGLGECKQAEMESGEGPERAWCGLLPRRTIGCFLLPFSVSEQEAAQEGWGWLGEVAGV